MPYDHTHIWGGPGGLPDSVRCLICGPSKLYINVRKDKEVMDTATLDWRDSRQYYTDGTRLWDILYGEAIFKALAELDEEFGYEQGWRSWLAADVAYEIRKRLVGVTKHTHQFTMLSSPPTCSICGDKAFGHPYTCDKCSWGRKPENHSFDDYLNHMTVVHGQDPLKSYGT